MSSQPFYPFGPSGGIGGTAFYEAKPADAFKIIRVWGRCNPRINQIGVDWITAKGVVSAGPFGGDGGSEKFSFDIGKDDYLTGIYGSVGEYKGAVQVFSLKFGTMNSNISPTFGTQQSFEFSFVSPLGFEISWIFGRAGAPPTGELDALAVALQLIEK